MWRLARSNIAAHLSSLIGTIVVVALAAAVLSAAGVLIESGVRAPRPTDGTGDASLLTVLAGSFIGTASVVVILVVAATVSLAMRPRQRDLAVLRALGATRRQVRRMVAAELLLLTAVVAPLGALPGLAAARLTTPLLTDAGIVPPGFSLTLSPLPVLGAVVVLAPVAVAAAFLATRETLRLPPTAAVTATLAEPREVGRTRRVLAAVTAAGGLAAAGTPLVVPGTIGGATAASSALLLVAAAALAGPVLVAWALGSSGRAGGGRRRPVTRLAFANTRGFSRRLTAVIVPLAAVIAVGTVQTSTGDALGDAAAQQLSDGLQADLVVTAPDGLDDEEIARIQDLPEVDSTTALAAVPARVRTDDEEIAGLEGLSWEPYQLRVLPLGGPDASYDPDVVAGSLDDLDDAGSIAVSSDARFTIGHGMSDTVAVQLAGGETTELRVVAVYDRGLGFGDYTLGEATLAEHRLDRPVDTVLVSSGAPDTVAGGLRDLGLETVSQQGYVESATAAGEGQQRLSAVLLLALLGFMLVGAANALVMLTAGRRGERALLGRIGLTRPQQVRLALVESAITATAAIVIGTLAVVPAVLGVSLGLLGPVVPVLDVTTYGVLVGLVVLVSVACSVPAAARR
ncbi:FtsX-like permease family protein [Nocardioides pantholopis]|uniref:FtsX-like permease family protein n=1 Tax=Nocardioides pantholopis TaxID=2483798 RepID=UPI000F08994A|nr:FtsX-like permease family protein [Nocardioides pantholopis]